jgi:hypothetical protein
MIALTSVNFQVLQWVIWVVKVGLFDIFSLSSELFRPVTRRGNISGRDKDWSTFIALVTIDEHEVSSLALDSVGGGSFCTHSLKAWCV